MAKTQGFDPNPNHLTTAEYQQLEAEKKEFTQKQLDAGSEFMWQHWNRILRVIDKSLERGIKAQLIAERKERKETAQEKRAVATPKQSD